MCSVSYGFINQRILCIKFSERNKFNFKFLFIQFY